MDPMPSRKTVLVFDGNVLHNWPELFRGRTLSDGSELYVVQCSWNDCHVTYYPDSGCIVQVAPQHESSGKHRKPETITITNPDFIIVRNQIRGPTPITDNRNTFYGLLVANIPAMNSLESCLLDLERCAMVAQLKAIEKRVGHDNFPLVPITYYDRPDGMAVFDGQFPCVIKVSHAHAGQGKAKVPDMDGFQDVRTILALTQDYCTTEPYITTAYGIRVQKIGNNYRVYKKVHTGAGWKSHFGGADLQFAELTDTFKFWVDECAKCYGGMDFLAVDAVCDDKGNFHILELNGSAIGIHSKFWHQDSLGIVDMAVDKMNKIFCDKSEEKKGDEKLMESAEEWKRQNEERQKMLKELRELDIKAQLREANSKPKQNLTEEEDTNSSIHLWAPVVVGLCSFVIGYFVSSWRTQSL